MHHEGDELWVTSSSSINNAANTYPPIYYLCVMNHTSYNVMWSNDKIFIIDATVISNNTKDKKTYFIGSFGYTLNGPCYVFELNLFDGSLTNTFKITKKQDYTLTANDILNGGKHLFISYTHSILYVFYVRLENNNPTAWHLSVYEINFNELNLLFPKKRSDHS